jgi:ribosomal protein S27AE
MSEYGRVVLGSVRCPRCGMVSHNPNDIAEGYCGNCHDWTAPVVPVVEVEDHLDRFVPLGFIWDGRFFEFVEGGGTREVDGWSGDLGNGWTWEIGPGDPDDD